ncbi:MULTISPECIES: phosphatidylglycerol lysyltransferase domain-containing protein [unclassified Methanosarcina]|uniref:phosphatidylglycerol lysyltransferase domain-containing protein n=1 Tax=unclassified Methanosarcina TaxID=2644672 RepID=UPI0006159ED6|nr:MULTISPECIES: phosphatidylglycerol lysyltransferase domain-containing protein [unclassified Methanosarcina]AKB18093.1 hypothetical protein MSWHS_1230 [Methanosarcina sp. WWM596]AKB21426.1 hypothetical protein MSWH1_1155 [Methanosarcina sp. WH1]
MLIDPDTAQWMQELDPGLMLVPDRNNFEYVYMASDLVELPGKKSLKIRSHLNRFRKNCLNTVEQITSQNQGEMMEFLKEGIYKTINEETAAVLIGEVEYINREIDLGVGGLREVTDK